MLFLRFKQLFREYFLLKLDTKFFAKKCVIISFTFYGRINDFSKGGYTVYKTAN